MKIAAPIFFVVAVCSLASVRGADEDFFAKGISQYQAGQFGPAARSFEEAARLRPATGAYINLGLAEWQEGHGGPAILAWERALWIDPFNKRAAQDLQFARQVTELDAERLKWFERLSTWLPPAAWLWLCGASLWLAAGMVLLPPVFRRPKASWRQTAAACAIAVFLFSLAGNWGVVSRTRLGVVVDDNAALLLTPTRDAEVTSTLTAGEPARKLRARGNYYLIRTGYGTGWIERKKFGLISP